MAQTFYKCMFLSDGVSGRDVTITVGAFPDSVDPSQRNPDGSLVNSPAFTFNVNGTLDTTLDGWMTRVADSFNYWCQHRAQEAQAAAILASQQGTILTLPDPTTS